MPKPGPKPYECIRRAWHSDSHGPLRCQVMQKAFSCFSKTIWISMDVKEGWNRMVTRMHRPETTLSAIWREKMTKTVMRVDEILYSTARSQAEYEDPSTLASRLTDAVDSIVARNEEGEELEGRRLLPCVEAALTIAQQPLASPINRNNRTYAASRNSLREIRPREQSQGSRLMAEPTGGDEWFDRNGEGAELGFKTEGPQLWQSAAERPLLCDSFGNRVQTRSYGQQGGMLNQPSNGSLIFRGDLNQPSAGPLGDPLLQTVWPLQKQSSRPTPTEIAFLLPLSLPGSSDAVQGTGPRRSSSREEATLGESMDPQQCNVWEGIGRKGGSKWELSPWQGQRLKDSEDPPTKRARQEPTCQ